MDSPTRHRETVTPIFLGTVVGSLIRRIRHVRGDRGLILPELPIITMAAICILPSEMV